jgi:hypothetical protein
MLIRNKYYKLADTCRLPFKYLRLTPLTCDILVVTPPSLLLVISFYGDSRLSCSLHQPPALLAKPFDLASLVPTSDLYRTLSMLLGDAGTSLIYY